jgi:hypothetical protein
MMAMSVSAFFIVKFIARYLDFLKL